jgi:hypothetical protein
MVCVPRSFLVAISLGMEKLKMEANDIFHIISRHSACACRGMSYCCGQLVTVSYASQPLCLADSRHSKVPQTLVLSEMT